MSPLQRKPEESPPASVVVESSMTSTVENEAANVDRDERTQRALRYSVPDGDVTEERGPESHTCEALYISSYACHEDSNSQASPPLTASTFEHEVIDNMLSGPTMRARPLFSGKFVSIASELQTVDVSLRRPQRRFHCNE